MKKLFAILVCSVLCVAVFASCNKSKHEHTGKWVGNEYSHYYQYTCGCPSPDIAELHSDGNGDGLCDVCSHRMTAAGDYATFTAYTGLVTKDEFQQQYEQAYNSLQPKYTKDFVYTYTNAYTEITEDGEDSSTTNERMEYDADSQIVLFNHEFRDNNVDGPADESYTFEYREKGGMLQFYDSRTGETETRALGFDEFWEFAHSRIPFVLFPNPYKLFDNTTYYVDESEDGTTVFTLYDGDENDYSLRQIYFTGTEMLYRSKRYVKEADYEDLSIDVNRIYNAPVTLTPIGE